MACTKEDIELDCITLEKVMYQGEIDVYHLSDGTQFSLFWRHGTCELRWLNPKNNGKCIPENTLNAIRNYDDTWNCNDIN